MNWIQDFSLGRDYGPARVRAQIRGSRNAGVDEFILWDAAVTYTADALEPVSRRARARAHVGAAAGRGAARPPSRRSGRGKLAS